GQSHALSIAETLGAPEEVLSRARTLLKDRGSIVEEAMEEIARLRASLERRLMEIERQKEEIEQTKKHLEEELSLLKQKRRKHVDMARKKALEYIEATKRRLQGYLEELERSSKAEIKKKLKELSEETARLREKLKEERARIPVNALKEGMTVRIGPDGPVGQITRIDEKVVTVTVRGFQVETEPQNLYPAQTEDTESPEPVNLPLHESPHLERRIDVRGKTKEEAIATVDKLLNKAVLEGTTEIIIIHGIGTGALQKAIREFLREHPLVDTFRSGTREEGSDGVTVATLK
ncbi:MAG: hypothetical protein D6778_03330, partial [Nitrospirae bacterium]